MKLADIRNQSAEELEALVESTNKELFQARLKHSLHQLDNPMLMRQLRHRIAQVKTVLNEKRNQKAAGGSKP